MYVYKNFTNTYIKHNSSDSETVLGKLIFKK